MYLLITGKTKKGEEVINKLMTNKTYGLATKSYQTKTPLVVKITPTRGQKMFNNMLKINPYVAPAIDGPFRKILNDYGAKDKDFLIEVKI